MVDYQLHRGRKNRKILKDKYLPLLGLSTQLLRDKDVFVKYCSGESIKDLSEFYGVTPSRIRQFINRAVYRIDKTISMVRNDSPANHNFKVYIEDIYLESSFRCHNRYAIKKLKHILESFKQLALTLES